MLIDRKRERSVLHLVLPLSYLLSLEPALGLTLP